MSGMAASAMDGTLREFPASSCWMFGPSAGILQIVQSNDVGLVCVNASCMEYLADESFLGELLSIRLKRSGSQNQFTSGKHLTHSTTCY